MLQKNHFLITRVFLSFSLSISFGFLASCAGRNINSHLFENSKIMVRQWTLATHGSFAAGDRGNEFSNPVLFENTILFGNQSEGLVSLYPSLMQIRWTLPIQGGVISEISINRESLYFGGGDGFLYSVNAENGRVLWRYDLHNPIISKPSFDSGRVFVTTSDDTVYAFDAGTGKWLWHYRRRSSGGATVLGASSPLIDGNELLTGLSDGFLVALSVQDGQLKWERKLHQGPRFTDVDAHPILDENMLYVPSYDGALYALKRHGGEIIWRFDAGGTKQVHIEEGIIYLASTDGFIYALQKSNAQIIWKFEIDRGSPTHLAFNDQYVMFGSSFQYFYVIDKKNGKGLYRFNAGFDSGFYGSPLYDPGKNRLYTLSSAGNFYSFSLRQPPRKFRPRGMTDPYLF